MRSGHADKELARPMLSATTSPPASDKRFKRKAVYGDAMNLKPAT